MIKENVKELLKRKKMSQKDLANRLGVSQETVSRQIGGNPTLNTLVDMASALEVNISDLFGVKDSAGKSEYKVVPYDMEYKEKHEEFLNQEAREGWELVAATTVPIDSVKQSTWFYFKR